MQKFGLAFFLVAAAAAIPAFGADAPWAEDDGVRRAPALQHRPALQRPVRRAPGGDNVGGSTSMGTGSGEKVSRPMSAFEEPVELAPHAREPASPPHVFD